MATVVKELFLSKNYLVISTPINCKLVFAPQGDGTYGGDEMVLRGGRWCFRIADFIIGSMLPNGEREQIGGDAKGYRVNLVYNSDDLASGEQIDFYTTFRNPAEINALDGQQVTIDKSGLATQGTLNELNSKFNFEDTDVSGNSLSRYLFRNTREVRGITNHTLLAGRVYPIGTVFVLADKSRHFIACNSIVQSIPLDFDGMAIEAEDFPCVLLGDLYEYDNGTVNRLNGYKMSRLIRQNKNRANRINPTS